MIKALLYLILLMPNFLFAASAEEYIDKSKCDQIIDKQLYQICYSYKYKGALSGWVRLDGARIDNGDIKKRPRSYNAKFNFSSVTPVSNQVSYLMKKYAYYNNQKEYW